MIERLFGFVVMTAVTGTGYYVNSLGPTLQDRTAFDGSVPYTISTAAYLKWTNTGGSNADIETHFCLNGVPGKYNISLVTGVPSAMRSALTKQCGIRLRDIYVIVPPSVSDFTVNIYVGNPSESVPALSALNTHLSFHNASILANGFGLIRIPDMDGIVVAAGLNVMVSIKGNMGAGENTLSFHSACDIDD